MAGRFDPVGPVGGQVALGEDRVDRTRFVRSVKLARAIDRLRMPVRRPSFCGEQVVPAVDLVDMRTFRPDRLLREVDAAIHQQGAFAAHLHRREVEFLQPQGTMTLVKRFPRRFVVIDDPGTAILEIERRIDSAEAEPNRIAPGSGGIARRQKEIVAAFDTGVGDPELPVVMGDRRREEPAIDAEAAEIDLPGPIDGVPDLPPVH